MAACVTGLILAAGKSSRMGEVNKLTKQWRNKPLMRHVYDAASHSSLSNILVVTGHESDDVLSELPAVRSVHNSRFHEGMGTSIGCGVAEIDASAVLILLGDMPLVSTAHINALLDEFNGDESAIVCATHNGKRGNPVLFGKAHFEFLRQLTGDQGGRTLIEGNTEVRFVEIGAAGTLDFDTPDVFESYEDTYDTAPNTS